MAPRRMIRERRACWQCWNDFTARVPEVVFCSTLCGDQWRYEQGLGPARASRTPLAAYTTTTTRPAMAGREA